MTNYKTVINSFCFPELSKYLKISFNLSYQYYHINYPHL